MKSIYEERPWLKLYPPGIPSEIEIPEKSVGEAFDESAEKWKDRTAIIFYGNKISYKELKEKIDRFANGLFHLGIKKGDRVALLLLNSPEFIIAFFAAIKVGAILTPISPVYVSSEIKQQLEDSGAETIISQDILYEGVEKTEVKLKNVILSNIGESLPRLSKFLGKSVLRGIYQKMVPVSHNIYGQEGFYQFQELINKYPPNPPRVTINPKEDLATLPYTGGTTGPPKGVTITHYNLIAEVTQYQAFNPIFEAGKEVLVGYMPFYHIGGQARSVMDAILWGNSLVVITSPDLDDILSAIVSYKATSFTGVPAIYEALKDYEKTDRVNWKKLKAVTCGGDFLNESTFLSWKSRTGVEIHEGYGMTELAGVIFSHPIGRSKVGTPGFPLPNNMAAIVDPEKDEFLPTGQIGELVVIGPAVTQGYWNKPEATKDCEAIIDGKRWFRTGDLASMEEEGYFCIYDRKRDLIKYKGLRVFAREVEEVLNSHPQIKEAAVIGVRDIKVGENVKALVVLEADARGKLSEMEIVEYCQDKLAHYKIPKIVEFVGEIPKTDIGKPSRREVREAEISK